MAGWICASGRCFRMGPRSHRHIQRFAGQAEAGEDHPWAGSDRLGQSRTTYGAAGDQHRAMIFGLLLAHRALESA